MKKWMSPSNVLTLIVAFYALWRVTPLYFKNAHLEGQSIATKTYSVIYSPLFESEIDFPTAEKTLTIFWATWCGPCKVEMNRLKNSVKEKKIGPDKIFAINPFESVIEVKKFLKDNSYPFTFLDAPDIARELQIEVTPTMLLLDHESVNSVSSGMSLIGIWKAERYLQSDK